MRIRSVLTVFAITGALAAGVLRCAVPPAPPPSQALSTSARALRGAFISLTGDNLDRDGLVASLRELRVTAVVIQTTANQDGAFVRDRASLALELQAKLDADIFIGTYQNDRFNGKPMEALLQPDSSFTSCYPGGRALDPNDLVIDKLRICSQDVSKAIVDEMGPNASTRIGCYITHEIELVDTLPEDGRARLARFFRESASPCADAERRVATSPIISKRAIDPKTTALLFGAALQDSKVTQVLLQDGVGAFDPEAPRRAQPHYDALRLELLLRSPSIQVWANVEAFDCEPPDCKRTHPTNADRFKKQLCAARARVDGIFTYEYLHHLAGRPLVSAAPGSDASPELSSIVADIDASAQLRSEYDKWRDAGSPCPQ